MSSRSNPQGATFSSHRSGIELELSRGNWGQKNSTQCMRRIPLCCWPQEKGREISLIPPYFGERSGESPSPKQEEPHQAQASGSASLAWTSGLQSCEDQIPVKSLSLLHHLRQCDLYRLLRCLKEARGLGRMGWGREKAVVVSGYRWCKWESHDDT